MNKTLKKIWDTISTILVVIIVLCAIFLTGSRIMGFQCYTVISGSMEPAYSVGDLLYVIKTDPTDIQVGDPITFVLNEELVVATHRVVRIDSENSRFYTKGDANETEDNDPVHFNNVLGVARFSIPYLGYVASFVQNPPGLYITVAACVILLLAVFLPDMLRKKSKSDEKKADEITEASNETIEENERLKSEIERLRAEMAANDRESKN